MASSIVQVSEGKLQGMECKTLSNKQYYTFKGIPYAKPPVGELRFSIPHPPEPWEGVRDATKNCNISAQMDRVTNKVVGSEDCLYLNVYTPALPAASSTSLPVMVYIHGGGFVFGCGTDELAHGADYLIEKDVVVVSLNYRLGILGFLSLDRNDAPGNMGLRDQVLALKWVQKNISKFGGDPNNVTVFGISAGGASIEYLLLSPTARGLFHKAIMQSGSSLLHWAHRKNMKDLVMKIPQLKSKINIDDDSILKILKELSTEEVILGSMSALAADAFKGGINFGFVPIVEKNGDWEPFLNKTSYELLTQGEFARVPIITGFCAREGLLMVGSGQELLEKCTQEKNFIDYLPFNIDNAHAKEIVTKLRNLYLEADNSYSDVDAYAIDLFSDTDFIGGIYVSARFLSKHNFPVYFYEFSYDGKLNYLKVKYGINRDGACHGDDGGYVLRSNILPINISDTDKLVRDRIVSMFTNFAKHGDPTPKIDSIITTKWEPIAETGMVCLQINENLTMQQNPYPERMRLYEELYAGRYSSK